MTYKVLRTLVGIHGVPSEQKKNHLINIKNDCGRASLRVIIVDMSFKYNLLIEMLHVYNNYDIYQFIVL